MIEHKRQKANAKKLSERKISAIGKAIGLTVDFSSAVIHSRKWNNIDLI